MSKSRNISLSRYPYYGWRMGSYYFDPVLLEVDCGESNDRDSAVAGLLAVASLLRRERVASLGRAGFGVFFVMVSVGMAFFVRSFLPGAPILFLTAPLVFAAIGVIVVAFSVWMVVKYGRMASIMVEVARMVEVGLIAPEEVCSKNVQTVIELYRIKQYGRIQPYGPTR